MFGLQKSLRNSKNDVYVAKRNNSVSKRSNDLHAIKCSCGSTHFRYEQEVTLAGFSFYGYTCMACGELMFIDKEGMIDHPMSGFEHSSISPQNKLSFTQK